MAEEIGDCLPLVMLKDRKEITKTLDRYLVCSQLKGSYYTIKPRYCEVTYCSPCQYFEFID